MNLLTPALLGNFFEAGWAIQVLLSDMDRTQYLRSRLARPAIEKHLRTMIASAKALPPETRATLSNIDWAAWAALEHELQGHNRARLDKLWTVLTEWLPPVGAQMRRYRRSHPELFSFAVTDVGPQGDC